MLLTHFLVKKISSSCINRDSQKVTPHGARDFHFTFTQAPNVSFGKARGLTSNPSTSR